MGLSLQRRISGSGARINRRPIWKIVALALVALVQTLYFAEPVQAADESESADRLAEIVVSAQRREQRAQDVPISVTALSGDYLQSAGFTTTNAFNGLVPSLVTYAQGPQQIFFL